MFVVGSARQLDRVATANSHRLLRRYADGGVLNLYKLLITDSQNLFRSPFVRKFVIRCENSGFAHRTENVEDALDDLQNGYPLLTHKDIKKNIVCLFKKKDIKDLPKKDWWTATE